MIEQEARRIEELIKKRRKNPKKEFHKRRHKQGRTDTGRLEEDVRTSEQGEKATQDLTHINQIKGKEGRILVEDYKIRERLKEYFSVLLNEENP